MASASGTHVEWKRTNSSHRFAASLSTGPGCSGCKCRYLLLLTTLDLMLMFPPKLPGYNYTGNEDCLFLSVYSPANATGPLPVFVWM
jgi:hypothetical protein